MTRLGKIARLPLAVRNELNRRLEEGELGKRLVEWLNGLPEAWAVLAREFGGRAITEQNLSEWKQGGYEDWRRREEARAWARMLSEEGTAAGDSWDPGDLAEELAMLALVRLGQLLQNLPADLAGPEECQRVLAVARELTQLRRANAAVHRAQVAGDRVALERERWQEQEFEKLEAKVKAEQEWAERLRQQVQFYKRRNAEHGRTAAGQDDVEAKRSGAEPAEQQEPPTEAIQPNPTESKRENSGKAAGGRGEVEEVPAKEANGRPEGGETTASFREPVADAGEPASGGIPSRSQ